ncbi:phosphotransferase enzyme family protein [Streptomyces decoyicus]|uniref:phosphotransferase enzyme family protein n=1 Tax=Streptomyces decoyicus TaxID=249567 RepID=UPI0033AFD29E
MSRLLGDPDDFPRHAPKAQADDVRTGEELSATWRTCTEMGAATEIYTDERRIGIPGGVLDWASYVLGAITDVRYASWDGASSTRLVWELVCAGNTRYFLKISPTSNCHARESHAYRFAVPALGPLRAPQLMASDPDQLAVLLTAVPGQNVATARLTMTDRIKAHRQAGWLLRALHGSAGGSSKIGVDPDALLMARRRSVEEHLTAAGELLTPAERELVRRLATLLPLLTSCPTAFIHGDAQDRNLLWDAATGSAALLDFERSQPALAVDDFVRLATGPWAHQPRLRTVFFTGYGRELTRPEKQVLPALAALDAVSGLTWGARNGDDEVIDRARVTLKLLNSGAVL